MKKVLAGRGAVDYYLAQTKRGLADYYLPEAAADGRPGSSVAMPYAPGSEWWGGGATALGLDGPVDHETFAPLFGEGMRPDGLRLGRRFRLPEEAAARRQADLAAAGEITDPYERWIAVHELRRGGGQASVAAWDCTFSPVKSVSLLWAAGDPGLQRQVWEAHSTAVEAGLTYLEEHAAYVRAGRNGVRVHDSSGLVVARMNEWTSRDGDMQMHTHCVVLNRAETRDDGRWRALDGRALLAARTGAGAVYNRVLEAELTRRLQVAWRQRPDGLRELEGVDEELIDAFSTRRRAITARLEQLTAAYEAKYGHPPAPAVISAMAQDATLSTRRRKDAVDDQDALDRWEETARRRGRVLADLPRHVVGRGRRARRGAAPIDASLDDEVNAVLDRIRDAGRASVSRHDILRAALDVLPARALTPAQLQDAAQALVDATLRRPELLAISAPDVLEVPAELRRSDGTSLYDRPQRHRWALRETLSEEAWLLQVATESRRGQLDPSSLERAVQFHELSADQAQAIRELLGDQRRVGLLVGPAGAGKTRTLRAVVDAWEATGATVLGLTVSQAAADVLSAEGQVRAENTSKWLYETRRGRWHLPAGALVIVDEASMVTTAELVEIAEQTRRVDGKLLLVGDPAQLEAIHIGGSFDLLAERIGASHLHEVRRFTDRWERQASLDLRRRDPAALAEYAMRGRIHGGTLGTVETDLFAAWQADALDADGGRRRSVLMIVGTNDQAAVMGERARAALLDAGLVSRGSSVQLRDNLASPGDHIVSRRNDRNLVTSTGGWVVNGDVWTIVAVHEDGAASVRKHADGATITLPAHYLAEHTHLAYATTAHRAQGMTVDACHALITLDTSHEQLYVSATRGRHSNRLWVVTDSDRDLIRDDHDLPAPEHVLSTLLARRNPDRLSAHQIIEDSQSEVGSLARLGAIYEDATRRATEQWMADLLAERGLFDVSADRQWPALVDRVRALTLGGCNIERLVPALLDQRPIDDARSVAGVLHWRLEPYTAHLANLRPLGPAAAIPLVGSPFVEVAQQAADLMSRRWRDLRANLDSQPAPAWVDEALGERPEDDTLRRRWLNAATAVAAYRERYEIADHTPMLGPRPAGVRPDAQALYDHAQHAVDRYAAHRLEHLSEEALFELAARQQDILDRRPHFDPAELERARRNLDAFERACRSAAGPDRRPAELDRSHAQRRVDRFEARAEAHKRWLGATATAAATRRQIAVSLEHRASRGARR
ncbi:MobF family relaxase [Nitriliruptor alkaliphilus]|uniref:MobF family relaxase n=1 Tax=Nitriliruptor alkaliphilus TaxID=427918 RepID=UPI0014701632|nr:MobF family relaxase [Nitriliruptor alkaliphilus]